MIMVDELGWLVQVQAPFQLPVNPEYIPEAEKQHLQTE